MTQMKVLKWNVHLEQGKKTLQELCVTGTPEKWGSFNEKINEKLSKNVWQSTHHNRENVSTITQKKAL